MSEDESKRQRAERETNSKAEDEEFKRDRRKWRVEEGS